MAWKIYRGQPSSNAVWIVINEFLSPQRNLVGPNVNCRQQLVARIRFIHQMGNAS